MSIRSVQSLLAAARLSAAAQPRRSLLQSGASFPHRFSFSTTTGESGGGGGGNDEPWMKSSYPNLYQTGSDNGQPYKHPQEFVEVKIEPQEWDPKTYKNPLYRPKFRSRARIISAEDFAKRPRVGRSNEFETMEDAMVVLSWMDGPSMDQLYQRYVDMMILSKQKHGTTSHEYVCRVLAQYYNMSFERAAGIVLLKHREEQHRKEGRKIYTEVQALMDRAMQKDIQSYYTGTGQKFPAEAYTENPLPVFDGTKTARAVDDIFDIANVMETTIQREKERARLYLDGYMYKVDVDLKDLDMPIDDNCRLLMRDKKKFDKKAPKEDLSVTPFPEPYNGAKKRGPYKFMAQIVNVRELRRNKRGKSKKATSYCPNNPINTIVEYDGEIRGANQEEARQVSWKPIRDVHEHIYAGAQKGWLDREVRGDKSAWGKAPRHMVQPVTELTEDEEPERPPREGAARAMAEAAAAAAEAAAEKAKKEAAKAAAKEGKSLDTEDDDSFADPDEDIEDVEEEDKDDKK